MKGLWYLSWRHASHHRGQTLVLVLCLALTILLPAATHFLVRDYETGLMARADSTPMVAGAKAARRKARRLKTVMMRWANLPVI